MVNPLLSIGFIDSDDIMLFLYDEDGNNIHRVKGESSAGKKEKNLTMRDILH